jgi:O-antigen ligase
MPRPLANLNPYTLAWATLAAAAPSLLAHNVAPSPTFLNQALAFALWGVFVAWCQAAPAPWRLPNPLPGFRAWRFTSPLALALALLLAAALWAAVQGGLPSSLALSSLGTLLAAALLAGAGVAAKGQGPDEQGHEHLFTAFAWAWLTAGLLNVAIALIQVFAPSLPDGDWISVSSIAGRAVGNLRQPNHLSSLLLWSCIAAVALLELRRLSLRWTALALVVLVFAVVLTASRTGLVSVLMLGLWGLLDPRLARPTRALLLTTPLVYAVSWWAMAQWAAVADHSFGGTARLAESDISGSRFGIWANTLDLIRAHPWAGVGWGEFNMAWTLTPFPGRPTAFFDHTHNLALQLAVETGLPLATLVMTLLLWALARAALNAWRAPGDAGRAQRCAVMMVLMIGWHSLLEYPLWYAYFLLPAAWALGFALRSPVPAAETGVTDGAASAVGNRPWFALGGALLVAGALFSVWDYSRVAAIFSAREGDAPLEARIARGQRSVFFGHHADYAAVTSGVPVVDPARAFDRVSHYLLDTRLMIAWSRSLAAQGRLDEARHLAARLREFRKADADEFFAACDKPASTAGEPPPFQCQLPSRTVPWKDFLPR